MSVLAFALISGVLSCESPKFVPGDTETLIPDATEIPAAWTEPFDASELGWFLSVYCPSPTVGFVAGGAPEAGLLMAYRNESWAPAEIPEDTPLLNWVYAWNAEQAVVVGNAGTALSLEGTQWTQLETPTDQDLWGVWGASPDDLWAVGGNGQEEGQATVLRNQGTGWEQVTLPDLGRPKVYAFYKVWGTSADNLYIVGQRGAMLHWNGSELVELQLDTEHDLISLWGTGPDRIAAVGGRSNGVVVRYDGDSWTSTSMAPMPGLNGVWMGDPNTLHVAGNFGTLLSLDFDTLEVVEHETDTSLDLHAIFGDQEGRGFTVGGNFRAPKGPYQGIVLQTQTIE